MGKKITIDGETKSGAEWAKIAGVSQSTISRRIKAGATGRDIIRKPAIFLEFDGEAKTTKQWAEETGISEQTIWRRRRAGWPTGEILEKTPRRLSPIEFNGEAKTVEEWSEETGIPTSTIRARINDRGWSVGEALGKKKRRRPPSGKGPKTYKAYGLELNAKEWAEVSGVSEWEVRRSLRLGNSIEVAIKYKNPASARSPRKPGRPRPSPIAP